MIVDDKMLVQNGYSSRIPPSRKRSQAVQSVNRSNAARPILTQEKSRGQGAAKSLKQSASQLKKHNLPFIDILV